MNPSHPRPPALYEDRRTLLLLAGIGGAHLALTAAGLPGWSCPFRMAFGLPCPGCGLTRATLALFRGDWSHALAIHAFAPIAVAAFGGILLGALLPARPRARGLATVVRFGRRFRLGWLLLGSLLIYWIARFCLDGPAFRQLAT